MIRTYTVDEVAKLLDCEPLTAAERLNAGDLPGLKMGRSWVVPEEALLQRLNEIALEEAEERRQQRLKPKPAPTRGQKAKSRLQAVPTAAPAPTPAGPGRGRVARVPPALPALPIAWPLNHQP